MSKFVAVGEVLLCKGYAENKNEDHLKEVWIQENLEKVKELVKVQVVDGGTRDVLVGGIKV